jgi:hypothetical protein
MSEAEELTKVATRQMQTIETCREYARLWLQDEADGWLGCREQTNAVREMFDALGLPYQTD